MALAYFAGFFTGAATINSDRNLVWPTLALVSVVCARQYVKSKPNRADDVSVIESYGWGMLVGMCVEIAAVTRR
jgi:hypothetical protein